MDTVSLAHFDAGNFCDGVPLVGGLEWGGEECGLGYGLRGKFRVDAGGSEEEEFFDAEAEGGVDDVGLDLEVD